MFTTEALHHLSKNLNLSNNTSPVGHGIGPVCWTLGMNAPNEHAPHPPRTPSGRSNVRTGKGPWAAGLPPCIPTCSVGEPRGLCGLVRRPPRAPPGLPAAPPPRPAAPPAAHSRPAPAPRHVRGTAAKRWIAFDRVRPHPAWPGCAWPRLIASRLEWLRPTTPSHIGIHRCLQE